MNKNDLSRLIIFFKTLTVSGERAKIYVILHYDVVIIRKYILLDKNKGDNFEQINYVKKRSFKNKTLWVQEITLVIDSFVNIIQFLNLMFEIRKKKDKNTKDKLNLN